MQNLYEIVKGSLFFNKFVLNDLVCVEYTCPIEEEHLGLYTQSDYIVHVLSGKKTWRTLHGEWTLEAGNTVYIKKGAAIINQYFDDDFCMLGFFLPDDLIRKSLSEVIHTAPDNKPAETEKFTSAELEQSIYLEGFFQSMLVYFNSKKQPPDPILLIKLKELLIHIISDSKNSLLISYFKSLIASGKPSLSVIMESNYCYNLKLHEYAKMCHRSLSAFKRDFHNHYQVTPGKWLLSKRLDHAANLLLHGSSNISQIAFESGFEDVSHFSRAFKQKYNRSPRDFRKVSHPRPPTERLDFSVNYLNV